jgi:predicted nucleic acid-binding protein
MADPAVVSPSVPDRFVLDGSVTIAWLFADEKDAYADAIIGKLPHVVMLVPRLWHLEVANVLLIGERRKRCSQADTTQWLRFLSALPVRVDVSTETNAWTSTVNMARQHGLSSYDAAYLELAQREGVPLASLDAQLNTAAKSVGIARYRP